METNSYCSHGLNQFECPFCREELQNRIKIEQSFRKLPNQYELDGPEFSDLSLINSSAVGSNLVRNKSVLAQRIKALKEQKLKNLNGFPNPINRLNPISPEEQISKYNNYTEEKTGLHSKTSQFNNPIRVSSDSYHLDLNQSSIGKEISIADPRLAIVKKKKN